MTPDLPRSRSVTVPRRSDPMDFGSEAVSLARAAAWSEVRGGAPVPVPDSGRFGDNSGAFVTYSTFPDHSLRGCIGYPMPVLPLGAAIADAARAACHDPRFPDLTERELERVTVEVTVLTVPVPLPGDSPGSILDAIEIGRDGLMLELRGHRGLLLPQVPVEWGWGKEEYLAHLSVKAGLPPDAWTHPRAVISAFRGEVYRETSPGGDVVQGE